MGVSENSVPLNPMVLLIIIPIKWLLNYGNIPNIFRQTHIMLPNVQPTSHHIPSIPADAGQMRIAALRLWSCRWQQIIAAGSIFSATDINFHEFPYGYV
jgi:hypothetical protein